MKRIENMCEDLTKNYLSHSAFQYRITYYNVDVASKVGLGLCTRFVR